MDQFQFPTLTSTEALRRNYDFFQRSSYPITQYDATLAADLAYFTNRIGFTIRYRVRRQEDPTRVGFEPGEQTEKYFVEAVDVDRLQVICMEGDTIQHCSDGKWRRVDVRSSSSVVSRMRVRRDCVCVDGCVCVCAC